MRLQNSQQFINLLAQLITTVDEYYDYSFKVRNERCFVVLIKLIEQLEDLLRSIENVGQTKGLQDILNQIANAMANKDYVLIRDLLNYELRSKLQLLQNQS